MDYVVEAILEIGKNREQLRGLEITAQPPYLRHFTASFRPLAAGS
jgi:tryptophanase